MTGRPWDAAAAVDGIVHYLSTVAGFRETHMGAQTDGFAYTGPEDFILRHGKVFVRTGDEPPRNFDDDVRVPKECFGNCLRVIAGQSFLDDGDLTYVEGYAYPEGGVLAVHHAWLVDADGNVYDPTWGGYERGAYIGVAFSPDAVFRQAVATEADTMLTHRFPYEEPVPAEWLADVPGAPIPEPQEAAA